MEGWKDGVCICVRGRRQKETCTATIDQNQKHCKPSRRKKRMVVASDIEQDAGAGMSQAKASISLCRRSGKLDIQ